MTIIIGAPITLTNVSGTVVFGSVQQIAPQSTTTENTGAGGGQTGDNTQSNSLASFTNTWSTAGTSNRKKKKARTSKSKRAAKKR